MLRELKVEKNSLFRLRIKNSDDYETILVMRDTETNSAFPMFIGISDGVAISAAVHDMSTSRPMTTELLKNVIIGLGYMFTKAVIAEVKGGIYYANIYLEKDGTETVVLDSRPSDAIGLALRFSAPIFIEEQVLMYSLENEYTKQVLERVEKFINDSEADGP